MQKGDGHPKGSSTSEWIVFRDAAPYPEVAGPADPDTLEMLKQDYAGAESELTGIAQYIYQSIASGANEGFANALLQIAIVEMMHLDMLGDAVVALGGDPRFIVDGRDWSAANINYANDLDAMLRANIEAEETAIDNYRRHAARTGNKSVRDLVLRIVEDEKLHLHFFRKQLRPGAPGMAMDDRYERM